MIKLENVVLASPEQMEFIIQGMRNPMNSWEKSDTCFYDESCVNCYDNQRDLCDKDSFFRKDEELGSNDHSLMQRLSNAGTEHRKYMRMMPVYVRITAPLYWWKEFDTYKIGTVANSCSTMHKIAEKEFTLDDFSTEHLISDESIPTRIYSAKDMMETTIKNLNMFRELYLKTRDKTYWWQLIQLLPSSYNQTRNIMLNYEVLANIYRQRKNHKLDEWREVCKWIESLPYSELITVDSREAIKEELRKEIMKVNKIPAPWEPYNTAEMHPDRLITIAEMEADARRAIKGGITYMMTVVSSLVLILESTVMCSMGYAITTWQWWAVILLTILYAFALLLFDRMEE